MTNPLGTRPPLLGWLIVGADGTPWPIRADCLDISRRSDERRHLRRSRKISMREARAIVG